MTFPIYGSHSIKSTALKRATRILGNNLSSKGGLGGKINFTDEKNVYIEALTNITLTVNQGEKVGLVGHNGSGKSTLLRMLAGVYPPVSGTVSTVGNVVPFLALSLGMEGEMTGYECIRIRGLMLGLTSKEISEQEEEIADFSELGAYLDMPTRTYSSGMLMRLAFAISTIINPDILLMDEWVSVGDEKFQRKAQKRLSNLVERSKILVIASHSMELITSLCSRIICLENGTIISDSLNP